MKTLSILTFFSLLFSTPIFAKDDLQQAIEDQKVQFLLKRVEESEATFIRNGDEHKAKKARQHLESKMNMARKMFWFFGPAKKITAIEFIEKIASESSTTGEKYKLRLKSGEEMKTGPWLKEILKEFKPSREETKENKKK
jgi:hypothetical protein